MRIQAYDSVIKMWGFGGGGLLLITKIFHFCIYDFEMLAVLREKGLGWCFKRKKRPWLVKLGKCTTYCMV